ncbi:MAG: LEA type 2 family protein [Rubrivivax sp.]|nr:LEA type 2 family protein [Rubrivivax sp.]
MDAQNLSRRAAATAVAATLATLLAGCTTLPGADAPKVSFAGIEPLPAEGMELRFRVKLRVQNPGEAALEIDGVSLDLSLRGMGLASGVSPVKASVPRFGETLIAVPVTVPATAVLRQAWSLVHAREVRRIEFEFSGRLAGGLFGGHLFADRGELDWPPR